MGLLSWLFGKKDKFFFEGEGSFNQEVVGESFYQKHLKRICGGYSKEGNRKQVVAELHYENYNKYDDKAIRVDIDGCTIGYLSRANARKYRRKIEKIGHEGVIISCNAVIVGGKNLGLLNKTNFGVWLDLSINKLDKIVKLS